MTFWKKIFPGNIFKLQIPADLDKSWHIPRPTLARSSKSSQGSTSSNNSTQVSNTYAIIIQATSFNIIQQND